jgi:hypothetical protein
LHGQISDLRSIAVGDHNLMVSLKQHDERFCGLSDRCALRFTAQRLTPFGQGVSAQGDNDPHLGPQRCNENGLDGVHSVFGLIKDD